MTPRDTSGNCVLCYSEHHLLVPARRVVEPDGPLCQRHLEQEGYTMEDGVAVGSSPVVKAPPVIPASVSNDDRSDRALFKGMHNLPVVLKIAAMLREGKTEWTVRDTLDVDIRIVRKVAQRISGQKMIVKNSVGTTRPPKRTPLPPAALSTDAATVRLDLVSRGSLILKFDGDMFALSREDREFVYAIVDKLRDYGHKESRRSLVYRADPGEKVFLVPVGERWLEDMWNDIAEPEDKAAAIAAWWRGDPATKPVKE